MTARNPDWRRRLSYWGPRLAPCLLFLAAHYSMPHLENRIEKYGATFQLLNDTAELYRVVTHVFIHIDDDHLFKNSVGYLLALMRWPQGSDLVSFYGVFWGGALSGLLATHVEQRYRRTQMEDKYGLGFSVVKRAVGHVHKAVMDRVPFCGSSAAVFALLSYTAVLGDRRDLTATWRRLDILQVALLVAPEVGAMYHVPKSDVWSVERRVVGHWAHLGAIAFGLLAGVLE